MGIGGSILTKIGLPIAIVATIGFLLFSFKKPILDAVQGGASTFGQIISSPIGSAIQGFQQGLSNIPSVINIPFPVFKFTLGGVGGSGETVFENPSGQGGIGGSQGALGIQEPFDFAKALENLRNNTLGILDFTKLLGSAEGAKLTPFNVGRAFDVGRPGAEDRGRETREQILQKNPLAIGLFDDPRTKEIEFFPLSAQEVTDFTKFGKLKLSGQLFKELTNDTIF